MTWEDFSPANPDDPYPALGDLKLSLLIAFMFVILGYIVDRFILTPAAYMAGLHHTPEDIDRRIDIEWFYKRYTNQKAPTIFINIQP